MQADPVVNTLTTALPHAALIQRWRSDAGGGYQSWFLWKERLKNFRSIRRGLQVVVQEIREDTFGNCYRGSSLETVVHSIAEQRQIFKGADHAFLWKPKLRIPDIYENRSHQMAFGRFLDTCLCCDTVATLLKAVHDLAACDIRGVGPASANLLYFLHPTILPPTNTAIIKGYNLLTGANVKLGRWSEYLAMRQGIVSLNEQYRSLLSNDLGALAGLLFDIGIGRYPITTPGDSSQWKLALAEVCAESAAAAKSRLTALTNDLTHTEIQGWLRDLGQALGFDVWIANNDKNRLYLGSRLSEGCLGALPEAVAQTAAADSIALIDVLWISRSTAKIAAAFEVEHSTSIYSGIVRMLDLALGVPDHGDAAFFLVAPDLREKDVRAQFARPAFSRVSELDLRYIGYSRLKDHRDSIALFGSGLKGMIAISASLAP